MFTGRLKGFALVVGIALVAFVGGGVLYATERATFEDWTARLNTMGPMRIYSVADGDTVNVLPWVGKPRAVRLLGINTPEVAHPGLRIKTQCFGPEASAYVKQVAEGKYATIVYDSRKGVFEDKGRLLGYIYVYPSYIQALLHLGGIDLNKDLIEKGYAEEWLYKGTYDRADEFLQAEKKAQAANTGGWAACSDFKRHPRRGRNA